jgi:membrane protease YdiL (CAAX protease family)
MGCAVFDFAWRDTLLVALMLFLPFIDGYWSVPRLKGYKYQSSFWLVLIGVVVFILVIKPGEFNLALYTLLLVALPEEWFFRVYFMTRVETLSENKWTANIATSTLFAVLHVPTQGWLGLTVFVPSLILGWIYQQRQDFVLVILLHAMANIVYLMYFREALTNLAEFI